MQILSLPTNWEFALVLPNFKPFALGFITAVLLWTVWNLSVNSHSIGGHSKDSPSGNYRLSISAPMNEAVAGTYVVNFHHRSVDGFWGLE